MKRSARSRKNLLKEAKEQMEEVGLATAIKPEQGKYHTIFTRDRDITGTAPREDGLTKKQAVAKMRRDLRRQERRARYQQIVHGIYESGLKFEHTSEEQYGSILKLNEHVPDRWLKKHDLPAESVMLLVNSSSLDVAHEGRVVQALTSSGIILDVRASWLDPIS